MNTIYKSQMDTEKPNFNRRLFCIEYPGRVNNVTKMIQTLGGLENIGTVYGTKNRRVELRFRPDDVYCKPACGNRHSTIGLLIKVKVKKKARDENMPCSSRDSEKLHSMTFITSLVGVVDTIYKFDNLCDFQYLPMDLPLTTNRNQEQNENSVVTTQKSDRLEEIYDRLLPASLPTSAWLHEDNVPYFLTPPVFSRFDTIHYYSSQKPLNPSVKKGKTIVKKKEKETNTIGRTRQRRQGFAIFVNYSDNHVPSKPNPEALKLLHIKFLNEKHYNILRKLFEERPIWSKNGLLYRTNFSKDQLKYLLPTVAYYFATGPWRVMWCKYGFDPRKNVECCMYQTFDYRVRTVGGMKNKVKAKRSYSNYLLPYKSSPSSRPKVVIINRHSIARAYHEARKGEGTPREKPHENMCIFRPGFIPPTRQMFYQYCDVLVPEIQTMLRHIPESNPKAFCHPTLGFLPTGFNGKCREIVNSLVSAELRKQINTEEKARVQINTSEKEAETNEDEKEDEDEDNDDLEFLEDEAESAEEIIDSDLEESLKDSGS